MMNALAGIYGQGHPVMTYYVNRNTSEVYS